MSLRHLSKKASLTRRLTDDNSTLHEAIFLSVFDDLQEEITTPDELMLLLRYAGCNPSKKAIEKYWDSNTHSYTFLQFVSVLKQEESSSEKLMKAFQKLDPDVNGFITHNDLINLLTKNGERLTKAEVKAMVNDTYFNTDSRLDYIQFCDLVSDVSHRCQESFVKPSETSKGQNEEHAPLSESKVKSSKKTEPSDLHEWNFVSTRGCFYKDNGLISSHHFRLTVAKATTVWMTIKASTPKYGKYHGNILHSDMMIFLVEESSGKLIAFSDIEVDQKQCLMADIDAGVYTILTFSSGAKFPLNDPSEEKIVLSKGGTEGRFTRHCRDTLTEIFYRSDLDGTGFLSREEFNLFQKRSSGEECDDLSWGVVKESVEITPTGEITLKGFLDLNLMELRDPDGGEDEIWITLESLGYSKKLLLTQACPFLMEVYTKKGESNLSLLEVGDGGDLLRNAIKESIAMVSNTKPIKNKRDLQLHVAKFGTRTTVAVENLSHSLVKLSVDCSASENLLSHCGSLGVKLELDPKNMSVAHHLLPENDGLPSKLKVQESILR